MNSTIIYNYFFSIENCKRQKNIVIIVVGFFFFGGWSRLTFGSRITLLVLDFTHIVECVTQKKK